jgi:hypothetical protein
MKRHTENIDRARLEEFVKAAFLKYHSAAVAKRKAGENYDRELMALNLLFLDQGVGVIDVLENGDLQTGTVPPERRQLFLDNIQEFFLEELDTEKLPRA